MEEQQLSPLRLLPFRWSAVRYADPTTKHVGQGNCGHLRMEEPFAMGTWKKPAGYILCASPITTRDPQYWQPAEQVTCTPVSNASPGLWSAMQPFSTEEAAGEVEGRSQE